MYTSLQVAPPFEHFANSRMSRVQRWFVASRIYEFAPIKYLLKRLMMKQILRERPYERHVGLVGAPAGEEVGTRIVFDVIDSETFKNIVRLVSYINCSFSSCTVQTFRGQLNFHDISMFLCIFLGKYLKHKYKRYMNTEMYFN